MKKKTGTRKRHWTYDTLRMFSPCSEKMRFYRKFKTLQEAWNAITEPDDVTWIAVRILPSKQFDKYKNLKYKLEKAMGRSKAYRKLDDKYQRHYNASYINTPKVDKKHILPAKQVRALLSAMDVMLAKTYKKAFHQVTKKRFPTQEMIASGIAYFNRHLTPNP